MFCSAELRPIGVDREMSKGQRFTFTIEPDLYEPLKALAKRDRRSIGSLLNWLAAQYLEERQGVAIEPKIQHGGDRKSKLANEPTDELIDSGTDE
jgi:hypothetical protein